MQTTPSPSNLLLLWDRMGDYHRARWRAMQQIYTRGKVFGADLGADDALYGWQNTANDKLYIRLSEKPVTQGDFWRRIINYIKVVRKHHIKQVCIAGYGNKEYLTILFISKLMRLKVLMFAESWYPGNKWTDRVKGLFLRQVAHNIMASGVHARNHFQDRLGFAAHRIITGYSVVDNNHFEKQITSHTHKAGRSDNLQTLLCIARFAPEKNLAGLIRAFYKSELPDKRWRLQLVGGGPMKNELQALITDSHVELSNWIGYENLPAVYQAADCFVLPSIFEPWGLVVNEAMAASLPIILSNECGCKPDLLSDENGWSFGATKEEDLVRVLNLLSATPQEKLASMGKKSSEIIASFSPKTWAEKIKKAFEE
jgi:glycosyltransferase involved in cell wall biosynthesis